jgi:hypothetical protein
VPRKADSRRKIRRRHTALLKRLLEVVQKRAPELEHMTRRLSPEWFAICLFPTDDEVLI